MQNLRAGVDPRSVHPSSRWPRSPHAAIAVQMVQASQRGMRPGRPKSGAESDALNCRQGPSVALPRKRDSRIARICEGYGCSDTPTGSRPTKATPEENPLLSTRRCTFRCSWPRDGRTGPATGVPHPGPTGSPAGHGEGKGIAAVTLAEASRPPSQWPRPRETKIESAVKTERGARPSWRPAPLALESRWLRSVRPACDAATSCSRRRPDRRGPWRRWKAQGRPRLRS
jgi:hypothetical protein